jgi:four helix bundle protein
VAQYNDFEDLPIWQDARVVAKEVYKLTQSSEFSRDYGLKDQIQRASVSVVSNIAEGFDYGSNKQFIRFLNIAKGSTSEVRAQLVLAMDIGYISETKLNELKIKLKQLSRQIAGFIKYLESKNP